jgi:hypothetical protein
VVALFALLLLACGPPPRSREVMEPTPLASPPRVPAVPAGTDDDERPDVSQLTPIVVEKGVQVSLPGTSLAATLVQSWYGEQVVGDSQGVGAAAELSVRDTNGRSETVIIPSYRARTVLGVRLYVEVTRDGVFLFVVPRDATHARPEPSATARSAERPPSRRQNTRIVWPPTCAWTVPCSPAGGLRSSHSTARRAQWSPLSSPLGHSSWRT